MFLKDFDVGASDGLNACKIQPHMAPRKELPHKHDHRSLVNRQRSLSHECPKQKSESTIFEELSNGTLESSRESKQRNQEHGRLTWFFFFIILVILGQPMSKSHLALDEPKASKRFLAELGGTFYFFFLSIMIQFRTKR